MFPSLFEFFCSNGFSSPLISSRRKFFGGGVGVGVGVGVREGGEGGRGGRGWRGG